MDIKGDAVFFAELDDDYQDVTSLSSAELLGRLTCYFLIAPRIVLHPAYVWQSEESHSLLGSAGRELLRPPFTELELGAYDSVEDYMAQRIDQLRSPSVVTRELRSYEQHGDELLAEARNLSVRFDASARRQVPTHRRDRNFRSLLYKDLDRASFDSATLAQLLKTFSVTTHGNLTETRLGETLKDFVWSRAELVSVDTFLKEIDDQGFPEMARDATIRKRLLALYYETYCDSDTMIPGTRKLQPGTLVNPYDADVFWAAMGAIFGDKFASLSQANDPSALRALRDIRETADWASFTSMYFDTLSTVDRAVRDQPEAVVGKLKRLHPGSSRQYVLRQLWESRKLTLAGAAFAALGMPGFTLASPIGIGVSVAGGLGVAVSGASVTVDIQRFLERYRTQDLVKVRETIELHVNRAIRDMGSGA